MTGYVHTINRRRGLAAIATEGNGFTIIALLESNPINLGDQMEWQNATGLGSQVYLNRTKGTRATVVVHAHTIPGSRIREMLEL